MINFFRRNKQKVDSEKCLDQICKALKEVMPQELKGMKIHVDTKIDSLGIDSIKYINLFISLEDIIGKELEDIVDSIDLSVITTVSDIVDLVKKLQSNK